MMKKLTNYNLKIIAIILMVLDHIAIVFRPKFYYTFRFLGRISFPIFAFLLTEGYKHTSNIYKYFGRILLFAFISEIFYDYFFFHKLFYAKANNIIFTLALGLLTIYILDISIKYLRKVFVSKIDLYIVISTNIIIIILLMGTIAYFLNFSYGFYGILVISLFYLLKNNFWCLFLLLFVFTVLLQSKIQLASLIALVPIYFYNGKKGSNKRDIFYLFYPIHILILGIIKIFMG